MIRSADTTDGRPARPRRSVAAALHQTGGRYYDAAAPDGPNAGHWRVATHTDAMGCIRLDLQTLRNRSRYEYETNCYAHGIAETHAADLIGSGPRIQLHSGDRELDQAVEKAFGEWAAHEIDAAGAEDLAGLLRLTDLGDFLTGSTLWVLSADKRAEGPISLRVQVVEADRLQTPLSRSNDSRVRDGIEFDRHGRPLRYYILKHHPGDLLTAGGLLSDASFDIVDAARVIHWYTPSRPGQTTAVPRLTPALTLLAQLRDYTMATVRAARRAAAISGVIETEDPDAESPDWDDFEVVDLPDDAFLTLAANQKLKTHTPGQPIATYPEFKAEVLSEIGRAMCMPYNVVAGTSKEHNYSSGRLDWQIYHRQLAVQRGRITRLILSRLLREVLADLRLAPWYRRAWWKVTGRFPRATWHWPGFGSIDPVKEAVALDKLRTNDAVTLRDWYADRGLDWEEELDQIAREKAYAADRQRHWAALAAGEGKPAADTSDTSGNGDTDEDRAHAA